MSVDKVWLRFEKKKKDGTLWKLRIQDLPPERLDEAIDLRLKYFTRDEVVHRATGVTNNPEAVKQYKDYLLMTMHNAANRTVLCCEDEVDEAEVGNIIGISSVVLAKEEFNWDDLIQKMKDNGSEELMKLNEVFYANSQMYSAMKQLNLTSYLDDDSVLVLPEYRGYGIAEQFLKTRRLMCAELNLPLTGGWMTGYGTQIAAARDGWRTVFEIKYEDIARRHNLVFEDSPPTMKYMVAEPYQEK